MITIEASAACSDRRGVVDETLYLLLVVVAGRSTKRGTSCSSWMPWHLSSMRQRNARLRCRGAGRRRYYVLKKFSQSSWPRLNELLYLSLARDRRSTEAHGELFLSFVVALLCTLRSLIAILRSACHREATKPAISRRTHIITLFAVLL